MKITCNRKDLHGAVQTVGRAVDRKSVWPILNNILMRTIDGRVELTGYDLELGIRTSIPAKIEGEGALTVPGRMFADLIGSMPDQVVQLTLEEQNQVRIECGGSNYCIFGLPAEEFRALPDAGDQSFEIGEALLAAMIRQVSFAVSGDTSRAIMTGALIIAHDHEITLVATDSHRLAVRTSTVETACGEKAVVVPKRALDEVMHILGDDDHPVEISITDNQIRFSANGVEIVSRLIEGQFPNWQRVIPSRSEGEITLACDALLSRVKRAEIIARENVHRLTLWTDGTQLYISAADAGTGEASEYMELTDHTGPDLSIIFNAKYLIDFLNAIGAENVRLRYNAGTSPGLFEAIGIDGHQYVLMPMQEV